MINISSFLFYDILYIPFLTYIFIYMYINSFLKNYFKKLLYIERENHENFEPSFFHRKGYNYKIRTEFISHNQNNYIHILKYIYNYILLILFIFYYLIVYYYSLQNNYIFLSFHFNNSTYLYFKIIVLLTITSFLILKKNLVNQKNFEIVLGYLFFFISLLYYLVSNNLFVLIFIFELQSIIYMYIISNLFFLKNNLNLNFKKINKQPLWYFNSLLYQFWISFVGAILLIYTLLNFLKKVYFLDWINIEIYVYMLNINFFYTKKFEILLIFLPLLLGILLKLGLLPFFFWKPEIYKNFNLDILFLYMTTYLFSIIFFLIFLFSNYFYLVNKFFFIYLNIIIIFTLIILPIIFYSITELRVFLAYTSIFHVIIILISLFNNNYFFNTTFIYLFTYLFFTFYFIVLLYYIFNFNIWYLSDFQFFFNNNLVTIVLMNLFLGMAGIPPFLGFFSKILIISSLLYYENYLLFVLFFISSLIIAFYYIQNYRFFGYNLKNLNYLKNNQILLFNNKYINFLLVFIFFNILSIFFFNELFIFSFLFKIN